MGQEAEGHGNSLSGRCGRPARVKPTSRLGWPEPRREGGEGRGPLGVRAQADVLEGRRTSAGHCGGAQPWPRARGLGAAEQSTRPITACPAGTKLSCCRHLAPPRLWLPPGWGLLGEPEGAVGLQCPHQPNLCPQSWSGLQRRPLNLPPTQATAEEAAPASGCLRFTPKSGNSW